MKKLSNIFNTSLIILLLAMLAGACSQPMPEQKAMQAIPVETVAVKRSQALLPIRSSGSLSAKTESKLSFKTGGIIRSILADEGQSVQQGQLLAALDLLEIKAQVKQAELALEKAQRDLKRVQNLYADSVATLENLQDATTAMEVAQNNVNIANFNLQHSQIVAPANGKILRRLASENELAGPGSPVFLFSPTNEEMVVKVSLTDREVVTVNLGDQAWIVFDAWPGDKFGASVSQIANAADPYTGTYSVELTLDKTTRPLVSGFIARVEIIPQGENNFLEIPVDALIEGKGREGFVWIASGNTVAKRKITIHRLEGGMVLVSSGLTEGEAVVTAGASYLDEKSAIQIMNQ